VAELEARARGEAVSKADADEARVARRRAVERTIARLESLLTALKQA
jgi:hypothetical protein